MDSGGGRILKYARYVMFGGNKGLSGHRRAGRCMYVHGMACMCGIYLLSTGDRCYAILFYLPSFCSEPG